MTNKTVFCFLSALLLVHLGCSSPVSEPKPEMDDDMEFDRTILLIYAASNFGSLANSSVIDGKNLMKTVLGDSKASSDETEIGKMKSFIERVEKYEKQDDISKSVGEIFDLFATMTFILEDYDSETPNTAHSAIDEILDKGTMKKIGDDFKEGFTKFAETLNIAIDKYINDLTAEQKVKEQKLIDWQEKFKAEKEVEAKIAMLYKFADLF